MWPRAAWKRALRAGDPRARRGSAARPTRPIPTDTPIATRIATCWSWAPAPAGLAAALAAAQAGARVHAVRRAGRDGRRRCSPRPTSTHRRQAGAADWLAERSPRSRDATNVHAAAAHARLRLFLRTICSALAERLTDHLADARPTLPRERLWQVRAKRGRARRRRDRAAAGLSRTTTGPASCWPARRGPIANRYGVAARRRAPWSSPRMTAPIAAALDLRRAGVDIAAIADMRRGCPDERRCRGGAAAESAVGRRDAVTGTRGRLRVARRRASRRIGRTGRRARRARSPAISC